MEMFYQTNGFRSFIDVCLGATEVFLHTKKMYMIHMLENNKISNLISPVSGEIDGNIWLKYNIDTKNNLKQFFKQKKPDRIFLRQLISQIGDCILNLEKYLLSPNDLVLNPEYVLYDEIKKEISLIYIPGYNLDLKKQLSVLLEFMLVNFEHKDRNGIEDMFEVYELVSAREFEIGCLSEFAEGMNVKKQSIEQQSIKQSINNSENITCDYEKHDELELISDDAKERKHTKKYLLELMLSGGLLAAGVLLENGLVYIMGALLILLVTVIDILKNSFHKDDNMDAAMREYEINESSSYDFDFCAINQDTTVLNMYEQNEKDFDSGVCKLIPLSNGLLSEIDLNGSWETIVVGRGRKNTDYVLPSNQISRIHACITRKNNQVYVSDKASANGTFVNSERLLNMQEYMIKPGDIVAFANEEFYVQ